MITSGNTLKTGKSSDVTHFNFGLLPSDMIVALATPRTMLVVYKHRGGRPGRFSHAHREDYNFLGDLT